MDEEKYLVHLSHANQFEPNLTFAKQVEPIK
jgi:hypothetical protein